MNLFLHIMLIDNQFEFNKSLTFENFTCTDIDNFSSTEVIQTTIKAIEQAERLCVYFELKEDVQQGAILSIIQKLRNYKREQKIFYSGSSNLLQPLIVKLNGEEIEKDELENIIRPLSN